MDSTKAEIEQIRTPRRQAPAAVLLILVALLGRIARQAWPLLLIYFLKRESSYLNWLLYITIGVGGLSALMSIIAYWRFFFYLEGDDLIIERGILSRTRLALPVERIQTINFREGPIHQLFQVVGLKIDTAGTREQEFSISALKRAEATALRDYLLELKEAVEEEEADRDGEEKASQPVKEELLLRLRPMDLLKIGVSQNHLRTAGIIIGSLVGLYQTLQDALGKQLEEQVVTLQQVLFNSFWTFLFVGLPLFLGVAFLFTLIGTVMRYFRLRFFRTATGFRVISGLLTRVEQSAPIRKIQQIEWYDNPVFRRFKMYALQLKQASSTEVNRRLSIFLPGCYAPQLEEVAEVYFPTFREASFSAHGINARIVYRRTLFLGVLPGLALAGLGYYFWGWQGLWGLLWILAQWGLSIIYYRNWQFGLHPEALQLTYGIWNLRRVLLKWYKIQSVEISSGIYERRHGLATLHLFTASGDQRIPFIPLEQAQHLRDVVLFKVETDRRSWM